MKIKIIITLVLILGAATGIYVSLRARSAGWKPPVTPGAPPPDAAPARADAAAKAAADYDPVALIDQGAPPVQVFLDEPRDPDWAPQVEAVIGGAMSKDLRAMLPEARGLGMKCKTLSCIVQVDAPPDKLEAAVRITKLVMLGPMVVDLEPTAEGQQWLFFTERRMADARDFVAWYRRTRVKTLAAIKGGNQPNPFPVPAAELPAE